MAHLSQSAASLRIGGDRLIPDEITRLLGAPPTHSLTKGEEIASKKTGRVRIAKSGMWSLAAPDCKPANLDRQIQLILDQLTDDLSVWKSLTVHYKMDLFCGLFMEDSNEGMDLSPDSLTALGQRGIKISLNIYAPILDG